MTEREWLACSEPLPMFRHLERGPFSMRKLRLFICACCQRVMPLIPDEHNVTVLATAERYADESKDSDVWRDLQGQCPQPGPVPLHGVIPEDQAGWTDWAGRHAYLAFWAGALHVPTEQHWFWKAVRGATQIAATAVGHRERARAGALFGPVSDEPLNAHRRATEAELAAQCRLLRDISGNPFRPITINPGWRTSTATALAQAIYDDRAFDCLPILADALEEGGCTDADILRHCRGPGPHVRGCWVVDLLLGKE